MARRREFTPREPKEYEERVIQIKRVSKKTKGGNKISFTALVVLGNRKGKVGAALGKAPNVASAIQKALTKAKDNIVEVNLNGVTGPHEIVKKLKGAQILMTPAPRGSGIIAGGTVRDVLELSGVKDASAKMLGSNNKNNNVQCAIAALSAMKHVEKKK